MSSAAITSNSNQSFATRSETWLSLCFLLTLVVLIVPLYTFLLDMFLAVNIASAILLLLVTMNAKRPLDVSVFPSLLLLLTLFRLSLNVATTRLILLNGDAGKIVSTFGDMVVGGSLVVGSVVFLILVTIQFIVITKGATRISEVNARFTLDALPGKQMSIDAELTAGSIDEKQAQERRRELAAEAEFYGAMDGASKYVRGDAIAGLVIMAVNIIGGVLLGITSGMAFGEALQTYAILTIGDGLVSQIPALIIATAAGILVTQSSSDSNLGDEISAQVMKGHRALFTGALVLLVVPFVSGLPKIPFLVLAGLVMLIVRRAQARAKAPEVDQPEAETEVAPDAAPEEKNLDQFLQRDRIVVEIGAGLIHLVESKQGKGIAERVTTLRKTIGNQYGFWVPSVRIRDNLQIEVTEYRIIIGGRVVGRGKLQPNEYLAINPGGVNQPIEGTDTADPAFGLPAKWVSESQRRRAELAGYTVVDAPTVLITHLGECLKKHAHELLSREDLQKMLDKLKEHAPTIVAEVRPDGLKPGVLHQLLINLLKESVSISSLERIIEAAIHHAPTSASIEILTEKVRQEIGPIIVDPFRDDAGSVRVILLEPRLEQHFRENLRDESIVLQPSQLERLVDSYKEAWEMASLKNAPAAALVDPSIRRALRQTIHRSLPKLTFISYREIPSELLIEPVSMIRYDQVMAGSVSDAAAADKAATLAGEPTP